MPEPYQRFAGGVGVDLTSEERLDALAAVLAAGVLYLAESGQLVPRSRVTAAAMLLESQDAEMFASCC